MTILQYDANLHLEFVVEFKDGSRDWVDPVVKVEVTDKHITVTNEYASVSGAYVYNKKDMLKYVVRPYSKETTYDEIEDGVVV